MEEFAENQEVTSLRTIRGDVHAAWRGYVAGEHGKLLDALPPLLVDARRFVGSATGVQRADGFTAWSTALRLSAGLATRLGFVDLAWIAADRARETARDSTEPDLQDAVSVRYMAWTLLRRSDALDAERVAAAAAEAIDVRAPDLDVMRAAVCGNLLFNAASAAIRAGHWQRALDLNASAEQVAAASKQETVSEAAIFGPRVVSIHRVESLWRLGDPEQALALARTIPRPTTAVPAFWNAGHELHLAAAAAEVGRDREALKHLRAARSLAPEWTRRQPLGAKTFWALYGKTAHHREDGYRILASYFPKRIAPISAGDF
jgi:tetratricopeptide (TPR) repeat protein